MSELFQGFLACVGAALFFGTMLVAVKAIVCGSSHGYEDDGNCGAPEGDQIHFRRSDDQIAGAERPEHLIGTR